MLGIVIPDITNPFFPQLVRGAEDAAMRRGYMLVTFNTDDRTDREAQVLSVLRARNVDGVLLVIAHTEAKSPHVAEAIASGLPIVCLDRIPSDLLVDAVATDNRKGAEMCIRHLLTLGHRKIAIITGPMDVKTAQERLAGYKAALRDARLPADPELILEGDFRLQSGHRLAKALLLRKHRPSALFVSNGMMALGVVQALEEVGLDCPTDIAVAVFDDLPMAEVYRPHLTAVAQPAYEIGSQGAELLINRIEGKKPERERVRVLLEAELRIRESTRPARRARTMQTAQQ
jgi:DNA-binding LacI/PurR family transcriptional regulator